ncbi:hypothetical protein GCM10023162_36900 [Klenkia terrae]
MAGVADSLILSRRDLDFLLHEWLQVETLTERERFAGHDRETFDAVLDLAAEIATEHFAPHNRKADENEPHVVDGKVVLIPEVAAALKVFGEAGLAAGTLPEELGGMQLPQVVSKAATAWFQAANVGSSAYPFLTMANAHLLLAHGSQEQIDTYVRPMAEGRWFGTMALSEPQAGSSLADLRRGPRAQREHRPPGAGQGPGRTGRGEGHLAVRRPEVPARGGRPGRAQRRRAGRPEPQDGLPRDDEHPAELRRAAARTAAWRPCST